MCTSFGHRAHGTGLLHYDCASTGGHYDIKDHYCTSKTRTHTDIDTHTHTHTNKKCGRYLLAKDTVRYILHKDTFSQRCLFHKDTFVIKISFSQRYLFHKDIFSQRYLYLHNDPGQAAAVSATSNAVTDDELSKLCNPGERAFAGVYSRACLARSVMCLVCRAWLRGHKKTFG